LTNILESWRSPLIVNPKGKMVRLRSTSGGGYGQNLEGVKEAYPSLPSPLVLQELTETIQEVDLEGEMRNLSTETR
jgi:hypothetical protein